MFWMGGGLEISISQFSGKLKIERMSFIDDYHLSSTVKRKSKKNEK